MAQYTDKKVGFVNFPTGYKVPPCYTYKIPESEFGKVGRAQNLNSITEPRIFVPDYDAGNVWRKKRRVV